ncbi:MAG: PHP domain-containing protein, partial [Planctomycetes bacterium]|nr:PHP domain-containing protein [Planctomycetota bacterium]
MTSRADLHIHSKYSNRPSEWFLRRIGAPESYVEPETIYKRCKARGMDFVTITDHNRIEGALDIAHLPGTFISSEITTYFPEDGCKVHCLVYGIAEEEFERIQEVRESIYELREFLFEEDILHSIAHPLYRINNRLSLEHIEKLLLLFNRFEAINGSERQDVSRLTCALMESLTEKKIEELANNYDIEPVGPAPWIKSLSGGSDDHSGIYAGAACTVTPKAETVGEFLGHLDALRYQPAGRGGSCLRFAHSIYHIAYQYYRSRLFDSSKPRN